MDKKSLSHTAWKCQYHIVFIPKYRKKKVTFHTHARFGHSDAPMLQRQAVASVFSFDFGGRSRPYISAIFWYTFSSFERSRYTMLRPSQI